jgi:anti-sigma regulatory factor (Ser/Thr protein kinase)
VAAVEPTGRVRFFATTKGPPIEVNFPGRKELLPGIGLLAGQCAQGMGFDADTISAVAGAVEATCAQVVELAYGNDASRLIHMVIMPNENALTVRIADQGRTFDFGDAGSIQGDPRFSGVIGAMDTVEHRSNPRGGNLVTLIRVLG